MDALYDMLFDLFGDGSLKVLALIVFVATAATASGVMALVHSRGAVKRRAAGINHYSGELAESEHSLRRSGLKAIQRVLDYTSKHYEAGDKGDGKVLRRRMVQAGIYNPQAVAMFFVARTALAVGLAVAAFVGLPLVTELSSTIQWLAVMAAGLLGYVVPSLYLDRRVAALRNEDRGGVSGFIGPFVGGGGLGFWIGGGVGGGGGGLGEFFTSLCA